MRFDDQLELGLSNLWRTKLRTILTTLGVTIGIGALVSMVSFGTGMQKNVTSTFRENDLFTSLYVTPHNVDVDQALQGNIQQLAESLREETPSLDDAALDSIRAIPKVEVAFPEIRFPVKILLDSAETTITLRALPAVMGRFKPFNQLDHGHFFTEDTSRSLIISPRALRRLNILLRDAKNRILTRKDSVDGKRIVPVDSLLGRSVDIVTSVVDVASLMRNPFAQMSNSGRTPFKETATLFRISGILKERDEFENNRFASDVIVPLKAAEAIPRLGFSSVWDLLGKAKQLEGYGSVYVRVRRIADVDSVAQSIRNRGFGVFSISDQLKELKRGFLLFDAALGSIGLIALVVAALGIINTMVMSILERRREIGVMKAIGGSESEIKGIFFVESGCIGVLGGVFGLGLGWAVTRIANTVMNFYMARQGVIADIDFFYIPSWLILGAVGFSIFVSLLAGLYPAIRAARVDPVEALRHD